MDYTVSLVGLGKVGLPLAAAIADAGIQVYGSDKNPKVVEMINSGENTIPEEPGLAELIRRHGGKLLNATTDTVQASKKSNVHIVIVPLFIDERHQPDFSMIESAARAIGKGLNAGDLVVMETTVPVGTTDGLLRRCLEEESGLKFPQFMLADSPEYTMTGYTLSRFKEFQKIVGGSDKRSGDEAEKFYSKFCTRVIRVGSARTAEFAKIAEGVYRDVNIGVANELFKAAELLGADFWQARDATRHKFCQILEPGNGVGGHCIPVYPHFIINAAHAAGKDSPIAEAARKLNDGMAEYFFSKASDAIKPKGLAGAKVAIIGLTYREGVNETAYTRSKPLVELFKNASAKVVGVDPLMDGKRVEKEFGIELVDPADFLGFDAVMLLNKEPGYKDALLEARSKGVAVIDCKHMLQG